MLFTLVLRVLFGFGLHLLYGASRLAPSTLQAKWLRDLARLTLYGFLATLGAGIAGFESLGGIPGLARDVGPAAFAAALSAVVVTAWSIETTGQLEPFPPLFAEAPGCSLHRPFSSSGDLSFKTFAQLIMQAALPCPGQSEVIRALVGCLAAVAAVGSLMLNGGSRRQPDLPAASEIEVAEAPRAAGFWRAIFF